MALPLRSLVLAPRHAHPPPPPGDVRLLRPLQDTTTGAAPAARSAGEPEPMTDPTLRELQVLEAITRPGATRYSAADELGISWHTVKNHLRSLYRKLGVSTEAQAWRVVHAWEARGVTR